MSPFVRSGMLVDGAPPVLRTTASSNDNEDYIKWNAHLTQQTSQSVTFLETKLSRKDMRVVMSEEDGELMPETPVTPAKESAPKKPAKEREKPPENRVLRLLEKHPLGLTLAEMAGGPRQVKKMKTLRPMLAEAIRQGLVMPVSQRSGGNNVYQLVKFKDMGPR